MNLFTEKLTEQERNWGIDQYQVLVDLIAKGYNDYSLSALNSDFSGWKITSWTVSNKILYILLVVFVIAPISSILGFVPLVILMVYMHFNDKKYEKYRDALNLIKSGKLDSYINSSKKNTTSNLEITENNSNVKDDAEALSKLFELLKMGAITQEEFDTKKQKILG